MYAFVYWLDPNKIPIPSIPKPIASIRNAYGIGRSRASDIAEIHACFEFGIEMWTSSMESISDSVTVNDDKGNDSRTKTISFARLALSVARRAIVTTSSLEW